MRKISSFSFDQLKRPFAAVGLTCVTAFSMSASAALAEDFQQTTTPETGFVVGFEDGARVMMCNEVGFLTFVWAIDQELKSPQFPQADVQYSDSLITITSHQTVNGISVPQSAFLWANEPNSWQYSGFKGIEAITDTCTDITEQLAESFVDLAMAASWGMPQVDQRVELFDILEDDLRSRLEVAQAERDAAKTELVALYDEFDELETELSLARMAVCEVAKQTQDVLVKASVSEASDQFMQLSGDIAKVFGSVDCVEEFSDAVFVRSDDAPEE